MASANHADGGLRTATRTSSLGNSQGRTCQIQPGRTLFVLSGAEAARRASANRADAEGPSGPSGPNHRLRAAARARSYAEVHQRGILAPSGKRSGIGSAPAGPEPNGMSSDDPARHASPDARQVCLVSLPGCFSGRPGVIAVFGPQSGQNRGVLGQNGDGSTWCRTEPSGKVRGESASAPSSMESSVPGRILPKDANPRSEPEPQTPVRGHGEGQGNGLGRDLWLCGSCDGPGFGRERGGGCLRRGRPASSDKDQPDRACDRTYLRLRTKEG